MKRNRIMLIVVILFVSMILQGCFSPNEVRKENKAAVREGVLLVQSAIDEYYKQKKVLPILTSGMEVPRYEKFRIDLQQLKRQQFISEIPRSAFEEGGTGYYLIINEETDPTVRIMDLKVSQRVNDVQMKLSTMKSLPKGQLLYPGFYTVDEQALDLGPTHAVNPFSGQPLRLMMDEVGNVYVDYATEIMQLVERTNKKPTGKETDLRPLLTEESFYVPVKSVPYVWKDNAPWPVAEQTTNK
nr:DUF3939 domain-containing protein [Paenibacillus sp. 481]